MALAGMVSARSCRVVPWRQHRARTETSRATKARFARGKFAELDVVSQGEAASAAIYARRLIE